MIKNPYSIRRGGPSSARLSGIIAKDDYDYVRCINPDKGTPQYIINTLWFKFVNELRRLHISTQADRQRLEEFVNGMRIVGPDQPNGLGGTASVSHSSGPSKSHHRRTRSQSGEAAPPSDESSDDEI